METKINKLIGIEKSKNPFKVPENYFAQFNEEIMNRLPEKKRVKPRTVPIWDKVKPWVYMAAMFVGLYITINFITQNNGENNMASSETATQQTLTGSPLVENYWSTVQITEEEFYEYLEEQIIDDGYYDYMYNQYYLN
ncbi:MAG: hypothetical protein JJE08_05750 [Proteiniphilum sp.]|nr:hypothetical protein [Proteiniphilum sp.]